MSGQGAGLVLCAVGGVVAAWQWALGVRDRRREARHDAYVQRRDGL
jgi:hypothetical protein